jgi:hypothetical protein
MLKRVTDNCRLLLNFQFNDLPFNNLNEKKEKQ